MNQYYKLQLWEYKTQNGGFHWKRHTLQGRLIPGLLYFSFCRRRTLIFPPNTTWQTGQDQTFTGAQLLHPRDEKQGSCETLGGQFRGYSTKETAVPKPPQQGANASQRTAETGARVAWKQSNCLKSNTLFWPKQSAAQPYSRQKERLFAHAGSQSSNWQQPLFAAGVSDKWESTVRHFKDPSKDLCSSSLEDWSHS